MQNESTAMRFFSDENIVRVISKQDIEASLGISMSQGDWMSLKDYFNSSSTVYQMHTNEIVQALFAIRGEVVA